MAEVIKVTPEEDLLQGPRVKVKVKEKASPEEGLTIAGGALLVSHLVRRTRIVTEIGHFQLKEEKETISPRTRFAGIGVIKVLAPAVTDVPLLTKGAVGTPRDKGPLK